MSDNAENASTRDKQNSKLLSAYKFYDIQNRKSYLLTQCLMMHVSYERFGKGWKISKVFWTFFLSLSEIAEKDE